MEKNNIKVLVVDDNENLSTVLVEKFNASGFEADRAINGRDGLTKALKTHPDIILLDLVMPIMSGLEMLKELRKDDWGKDAKVAILTLIDEVKYVADAMDSNVFGYIVKTDYSLDEVVAKVKEYLKLA
jgi:DNA-binding response OmpR family regulator